MTVGTHNFALGDFLLHNVNAGSMLPEAADVKTFVLKMVKVHHPVRIVFFAVSTGLSGFVFLEQFDNTVTPVSAPLLCFLLLSRPKVVCYCSLGTP